MTTTSRYDYQLSRELSDQPFHALLMAAMRKADTGNAESLAAAFPEVWAELQERYHTPGGYVSTEEGYAGLMRDRAIAAGELPPDCHAPNPCPTPDLCGGLCACQWPDEHDDTPKTPVAPVAHHLKRRMDVVANGDCECGHAPDSHLGKTGACMVADCLCISFDLDLGE